MKHSFQINGTEYTHIDSNGLTMTTNISFPNNGAGLRWGNNYSQIYDDSNLHISTDNYIYLSAPTSCIITSPSPSLTGSLTCTNIICNSIQVNSTTQPPNSNYIGYSYTYSTSSSYTMTTSWSNINYLGASISNSGVYIINATFPIYYLTNNGIQTLYYALSTSPLGLDSGAIQNIYNMSQGSACTVQASLSISRVLYVSTSANIYLIGYMSLSSPVFYITNNVPTYITYTRIA